MYTYFTEKESKGTKRQSKPNQTGIPTGVKQKYEAVSGKSFDDVRIHYNSNAPLQLRAYAYTRGNDVYIAPGQEKYLGHELGHVIQQKKGMVRANAYLNGIPLNTDEHLEREADRLSRSVPVRPAAGNASLREDAAQRAPVDEEALRGDAAQHAPVDEEALRRDAAQRASVDEKTLRGDVAQLAPIDWEALRGMWESGWGASAIALAMGLSIFAVYELIKCLISGKEKKETSAPAADTKPSARSGGNSVRRRDTRSKAPAGKKKISGGATSRPGREISGGASSESRRDIPRAMTPEPGREILEDTTSGPERQSPRDTPPVIPQPVTGVETIRPLGGSGEETVKPRRVHVPKEPKPSKWKQKTGNRRAVDPAPPPRVRPEPQEDPAETERKARMDQAVAEALGPGESASQFGEKGWIPCAPNGLFKTVLRQKEWINEKDFVGLKHDMGKVPKGGEGKQFYLRIRKTVYPIFRAKHSQSRGGNNKNYEILSLNTDKVSEWNGLARKNMKLTGEGMCTMGGEYYL